MDNNSLVERTFERIHSEIPNIPLKDLNNIIKHLEALYDAARLDGRMAAVKEFCYPK